MKNTNVTLENLRLQNELLYSVKYETDKKLANATFAINNLLNNTDSIAREIVELLFSASANDLLFDILYSYNNINYFDVLDQITAIAVIVPGIGSFNGPSLNLKYKQEHKNWSKTCDGDEPRRFLFNQNSTTSLNKKQFLTACKKIVKEQQLNKDK